MLTVKACIINIILIKILGILVTLTLKDCTSFNTLSTCIMSCGFNAYIGAVNNFIQVKFEFAINISTILCIFSDEAGDSVKHCGIIYGPNECHNTSSLDSFANGEPSASQTVEIPLSLRQESVAEVSDHDHQESYCYKITGTNRTNTITISGIFVTGI